MDLLYEMQWTVPLTKTNIYIYISIWAIFFQTSNIESPLDSFSCQGFGGEKNPHFMTLVKISPLFVLLHHTRTK